MRIIPIKIIKITCSNGEKYKVQINHKGIIFDKSKDAPIGWIGCDIQKLKEVYQLHSHPTWTVHY
jgi:hypothetical protein